MHHTSSYACSVRTKWPVRGATFCLSTETATTSSNSTTTTHTHKHVHNTMLYSLGSDSLT